MNANQALAQARKRWGKRAMIEDSKRDSSEKIRAEAKTELERLRATLTKEQQQEPENRKLIRELASKTWRYRYRVGSFSDFCGLGAFLVNGEGDTWEAAFAKADGRNKKAA